MELMPVTAVEASTGPVVVKVPCSGSSPPPPAGRPARSSAAAPPSGTDMSPCGTWRCSGPGALQQNRRQKPTSYS